MTVFAERFLEAPRTQVPVPLDQWSWAPFSKDMGEIYASGGKTSTRASTYASEKDNNEDTDRPNEGP